MTLTGVARHHGIKRARMDKAVVNGAHLIEKIDQLFSRADECTDKKELFDFVIHAKQMIAKWKAENRWEVLALNAHYPDGYIDEHPIFGGIGEQR